MKNFILIAFCSVVICATAFTRPSYNSYNNHTFTVGNRITKACYADELVIKKEVRVHNSFGVGSAFNKTFEKTETFTPGHGTKITMIKATDLKKNGASVEIKSGGLGQFSVTLKFQNHKHGFHYNVEIYAAKF